MAGATCLAPVITGSGGRRPNRYECHGSVCCRHACVVLLVLVLHHYDLSVTLQVIGSWCLKALRHGAS